MSFPKILGILAIVIFGAIGVTALFKTSTPKSTQPQTSTAFTQDMKANAKPSSQEIALGGGATPSHAQIQSSKAHLSGVQKKDQQQPLVEPPEVDRMHELFNTGKPRLPIVETVVYSSRVSWMPGKPAWVADYATHYQTSRHFIGRSLKGGRQYFDQTVSNGDRFNVFRKDIDLSFYLLIDTTRCKLWVYYLNNDTNERVLLKTYKVGLGRPDETRASGSLTPIGKYTLGSKIAVYKAGSYGLYNNQKTEMIRVFGTRWIPFDKEAGECTAPAKGLGLHGCPWVENQRGELSENLNGISGYSSDGCVRLATQDIEELFAVIITKPTTVELVKDYYDAELPGVESNGE